MKSSYIKDKYLIEYVFEENFPSKDFCYFITSLTNRFDYINEDFAKLLENKYKKKFKPIYIYSVEPNSYYQKDNYMVINQELKRSKEKTKDILFIQEYEDLSYEVSRSKTFLKLLKSLGRRQEKIFYLTFTTSFLSIRNKKFIPIGPNPKLATRYDNKITQYKLFSKLSIPVPDYKVLASNKLSKINDFPFYISAAYSSGGGESEPIREKAELALFIKKLRKINLKNPFLVIEYVKDIYCCPNTNGIILGKNKVFINCVSDQILNNNAYLGNIYPSILSEDIKSKLIFYTEKVGAYLSTKGYRGNFGCDFIVTNQGSIYINDLNPRKQGGYLCNYLSSKVNLLDLELSATLDEAVLVPNSKDCGVDYSWAHSKIKLHEAAVIYDEIQSKQTAKEIFENKNGQFFTTFYKKGLKMDYGYPGYLVVVGKNRDEVGKRISKETNSLLKRIISRETADV